MGRNVTEHKIQKHKNDTPLSQCGLWLRIDSNIWQVKLDIHVGILYR